ncbi:hypothetical protein SDC9_149656 [bioreactor metagenome]|uniref:Uncharacterized protein n=1 Tax=bioreactor metagenome TaxID=1076179 RepID=A0A645EM54_9ZZZZ
MRISALADRQLFRNAGFNDPGSDAFGLFAGSRTNVHGVSHCPQPLGSGQRLQSGNTGTDNQHVGRLKHSYGGEHLRHEYRQVVGRHDDSLVTCTSTHRGEGVHVLSARDAGDAIECEAGHAPGGQLLYHVVVYG